MNLRGIVSGYTAAVNPQVPLTIRVSTGFSIQADGTRAPAYATPGALTGSIAGAILTVSAVTSGELLVGQTLADLTSDLLPDTRLLGQLSGSPGEVGTYSVSREQDVASEAMTTALVVLGQVQALSYKDLQQVDALNLQGIRRAIYINGRIDGLVRADNKGGDLITMTDGTVWLVAMVLEYWPDWTKVAATLQDGS